MAARDREEIERALCHIRGVEAARVCMDGIEIAEIHIAASAGSRAKNIARDVRSYLAAALGITIDHKKISIAVCKGDADPVEGSAEMGLGDGTRVLFGSVNLYVEGLRAEAQVRLRMNGRELLGTAAGVPTHLGAERLIAQATLDALQRVTRHDSRLWLGELAHMPWGDDALIVVEVLLVRQRSEERFIGACVVGADRQRAAVLATLDALNRVMRRLTADRWTEIQVEPEGGERESEGQG